MSSIDKIVTSLKNDDFVVVEIDGCFAKIKKSDLFNIAPIEQATLSINATPNDAVVRLNNVVQTQITVDKGSVVDVEVSKSGYTTYTDTLQVNNDTTENITLTLIPVVSFPYYFGEIGNVFGSDPSTITESNWDSQIKPNGTNGGMLYFPSATSFPADMEKVATGFNYQWWIVMIPTSVSSVINDLPNYKWFIWDELLSVWVLYTNVETEIYTGQITLDGITWTYSAVRPTIITQMKFSKTQIDGQP